MKSHKKLNNVPFTTKELCILALLTQKAPSIEINLDELKISDKARQYAKLMIGAEKENEPEVIKHMRKWAKSFRRKR